MRVNKEKLTKRLRVPPISATWEYKGYIKRVMKEKLVKRLRVLSNSAT